MAAGRIRPLHCVRVLFSIPFQVDHVFFFFGDLQVVRPFGALVHHFWSRIFLVTVIPPAVRSSYTKEVCVILIVFFYSPHASRGSQHLKRFLLFLRHRGVVKNTTTLPTFGKTFRPSNSFLVLMTAHRFGSACQKVGMTKHMLTVCGSRNSWNNLSCYNHEYLCMLEAHKKKIYMHRV